MATPTPPAMTIAQAFKILGLVGSATGEEIIQAFRNRVKAAADGCGGFRGDMDALTKAKDFLLETLERLREQAQRDKARQKAQEAEREEKKRKKQRAQKKPPAKRQEPLLLTEASSAQWWKVIWIFEQKRGEVLNSLQKRGEKMELRQSEPNLTKPDGDFIGSALSLLQERQSELEQIRQREQEMIQALKRLQARRAELEQAVQTANALAEQLRTILEAVALV